MFALNLHLLAVITLAQYLYHVHVHTYLYVVAMVAPFPPIVNEVITTPYSVNISWVVPSIIFDQENYTVWYGTDMTMLQSTSELVQGSSNGSVVNGLFSTNITGLSPFTRYYYVIMAVNSVGSNSTRVMDFTTDETGWYIYDCYIYFSNVIYIHSTR